MAYMIYPSHVTNSVQLNPTMDINPKFLYQLMALARLLLKGYIEAPHLQDRALSHASQIQVVLVSVDWLSLHLAQHRRRHLLQFVHGHVGEFDCIVTIDTHIRAHRETQQSIMELFHRKTCGEREKIWGEAGMET